MEIKLVQLRSLLKQFLDFKVLKTFKICGNIRINIDNVMTHFLLGNKLAYKAHMVLVGFYYLRDAINKSNKITKM